MTNKIIVHTDGGARGNPGPAAVGAVIKTQKGEILAEISRNIGETTNNVAEYKAVIEALKWFKESQKDPAPKPTSGQSIKKEIHFYLDSKLVVEQLNGYFKVKNGNLRNLLLEVRIMESQLPQEIHYHLIPREGNRDADRLVNKALDTLSYQVIK